MKGILITGIHHWGFSIRKPKTSAGGDSYIVPPVTTLLGALSRGYCEEKGYATINGKSCTEEFIEDFIKKKCGCNFFWITYGIEEPVLVPYSDLLRENRAPYKREENRLDMYGVGVSAFGRVYGVNAKFSIVMVLDSSKDEMLKKLAEWGWQIPHLGSKESLVSVLDVKILEVYKVKEDELPTNFFTEYYLPAKCLKTKPTELKGIEIQLKNNYTLSPNPHELSSDQFMGFLVPKKPFAIGGIIKLKKKDIDSNQCEVLKFKVEDKDKYIVALKEGILNYIGALR